MANSFPPEPVLMNAVTRGPTLPMFSHFSRAPPASRRPPSALMLGRTQRCVSHEDLTDRPAVAARRQSATPSQSKADRAQNPEQSALCGSTGNRQLHPNDRTLQIQARCGNSSAQFKLRPVWLIRTRQWSGGRGGGLSKHPAIGDLMYTRAV